MANKPLKTIKFPGLADTYTIPQIDATLAVSGKAADSKATGDRFDAVEADVTALQAELPDLTETVMSAFVVDTASGAIATFPDGADSVPVKSLTVDIEPVQSGSGDPSPTNVRSISGWSEAKVTRTGVNVWDEVWEIGTISASNGQNQDSDDYCRTKGYIAVVPNTTYYLKNVPPQLYLRMYDANKNFLRYSQLNGNATYTIQSDVYYLRLVWAGTTYNHDISINYPSTDHDYHSGADNESYTIDLDGTRYGGTLDVGSGVLTVTHGIVDLGTLTWSYSSGRMNYDTAISDAKAPSSNADAIVGMCSIYPILSANEESNKHIAMNTSKQLRVYDSAYTDAASFKTAMTGQQLVYELATPLTVQLTAEEVTTLLGTNNIFADCGDVEVEYRADTKLYIDKLLNA